MATPTEIRLSKDKRNLTVSFDDGIRFDISAELLRVESPSAEVQGHDPSQEKLVLNKQNVQIVKIEPVGNYAVRLVFDDMHDTGIYSWEILHRLGSDADELMTAYHERVAEARDSK